MTRLLLALMKEEAQRRLGDRTDKDLVAVLYSIWMDLHLELSELLSEIRRNSNECNNN